MSYLPTNFTVGVKVYTPGAEDDMGEAEDIWAAPVSAPVYGWAPPGTRGQSGAEPFESGREVVSWDLDLYVPPGFSVAAKDRVTVPGYEADFEVEGLLEDYNFGPFGFTPGGRVRLRYLEG